MSGNKNLVGWMHTIISFAMVTTCLAVPATGQESKATDLQKTLSGILERQAADWNRGDLEKFMDAYWNSEDLTFCSGGNVTRGWQATLDRYRQRYGDKETMGRLTFSDLEVTSLGSEAALMLGRWHLVAKGENYGGNFTLVWRRIEGDWKIIHDHTSASEPDTQNDEKSGPR